MAIFSYTATTMEGIMVEGVIEAPTQDVAIDKLKNSGVIPIKVAAPRQSLGKRFTWRSSKADLLTFTTELSVLLNAGLPLDRGLNVLSETSESKEMKVLFNLSSNQYAKAVRFRKRSKNILRYFQLSMSI